LRLQYGEYVLRDWKNGDCKPNNFPGAFSLDYKGKQVGAVAGSINRVLRIDTNPEDRGHCQMFIKLMMEQAKTELHTCFKMEGVIGDTPDDYRKLIHILSKLGFTQINDQTWCIKL